MLTRRRLLGGAAAIGAALLPLRALAAYPDRPLRFIVPFTPGGNTDILGRIAGEVMAPRLGQPVVIENRAGAGGSIGADLVAKAVPDGYTLLFGAGGPLVANPVLQARIPYDVARDFKPIGLVGIMPMVCILGPRLPARSMTEFLALLRARPGQVTVATPGTGSAAHLTLELLGAQAGVRMTHVPYRGGSALVPDLIAGTVDASLVELPNVLPLHRDGQARIIGIAALERSTVLPTVETFAEAGLPGFTAGSFGGLLAPAGTPDAAIAALHRVLAESMAVPEIAARIAQVGAVPATPEQATPAGFARFLAAELAAARRAVELAGLKPE